MVDLHVNKEGIYLVYCDLYLENKMAENQTLKIHDHTTNGFARKMPLFLELPNGDYWKDWTKVQKMPTTCKKGNKYYCFVTVITDRKFAFFLRYSVLKKKVFPWLLCFRNSRRSIYQNLFFMIILYYSGNQCLNTLNE